jgi:PIN domain nuclease of toxin-antitoxin system
VTKVSFDSSAVLTFLLQERGWQAIHTFVARPDVDAVLPGPALTESVRTARRKGNTSSPTQIFQALAALGLRVEHPEDTDLLRAAELMEISDGNPGEPDERTGVRPTLSLGDALILAVTDRLDCPVLTRDGYWKWMADQGLLPVKVVVP